MLLLGLDLGSSAVKATLLDAATGRVLAAARSPQDELPIFAAQPGWAEQDPALWWQHTVAAVRAALAGIDPRRVRAIGIAYQMHGLVVVDKNLAVLRPAIIWCDSRAVEIGERSRAALGEDYCRTHLLNAPGNFTASKLSWVKENEPEIYRSIHKFMLPGDWLALRLTGRVQTTAGGLSEGMLWDFAADRPAAEVFEHFGFDPSLVPELTPTFAPQAELSAAAAAELGLTAGIPVTYRAGDQPNNAFALRALDPGDIAASAGTSGVVYGVTDRLVSDPLGRVNTFAHVSHRASAPRLGVLLCLNGAGISNAWLRATLGGGLGYDEMNRLAAAAPVGSAGLCMLPFGNGAERMLGHRRPGGRWSGLDFNRHRREHLCRAAQEGVGFAFRHGIEGMKACGLAPARLRAGDANLFRSPVFTQMLATTLGVSVELMDTDGAAGAARAAGLGAGLYASADEAFRSLQPLATVEPAPQDRAATEAAYALWSAELSRAPDS